MYSIKVKGLSELKSLIEDLVDNIEDTAPIADELAMYMKKFVHKRTGYLASTIYSKRNIAGADAGYAGYEELRGGSHAFGDRAIEKVALDKYADRIL